MKIKNKLIAGGLMSVVACALVGSITGTFAWYQYSNNSTLSMHGMSVSSSQNLYLKTTHIDDFTTDDLLWADLNGSDDKAEFRPTSCGANNGSSALSGTWYRNPDGVRTSMSELTLSDTTGYIWQATIQAKWEVKENGTVDTTKTAKLYVSDIAASIPSTISPAARMHINLNNSKYILVNPADSAGGTTTLSVVYEKETVYEWGDDHSSDITYSLDGTQTTLAHNTVINQDAYSISLTSGTAVNITVTLWLEGFAKIDNSAWWDEDTTTSNEIWAGFELTAKENLA